MTPAFRKKIPKLSPKWIEDWLFPNVRWSLDSLGATFCAKKQYVKSHVCSHHTDTVLQLVASKTHPNSPSKHGGPYWIQWPYITTKRLWVDIYIYLQRINLPKKWPKTTLQLEFAWDAWSPKNPPKTLPETYMDHRDLLEYYRNFPFGAFFFGLFSGALLAVSFREGFV